MDSSAGVSQVDEYFIVLVPPKPWPKNIRLKIVESDRYHQMMSSFKTPEHAQPDGKVSHLSGSGPTSAKLYTTEVAVDASSSKPDKCEIGIQVSMLPTGVVLPVLRPAQGPQSQQNINQRHFMDSSSKARDSSDDSDTEAKLQYFRTLLAKLQVGFCLSPPRHN